MNPVWSLAPVSMLAGGLTLWIFRRTTRMAALRSTIHRIQAYLLEFWIFADEPSLVWKSWKGLLGENLRLYRLLLVPLLLLSLLMAPLLFFCDVYYGSAALPVGRPAVVTLHVAGSTELAPEMHAPNGISIEGPAIRVASLHEVSWRIRPLRATSGDLEWLLAGRKVTARVVAGAGLHRPWREASGVDIPYPSAGVAFLGLHAHWIAWFLLFSLIGSALAASIPTRIAG